jgi:peptide/nickel transport system substrate-binding protein
MRFLPAAALALLVAVPAQAQKAKDTVRMAFIDPIATILEYEDPKPETRLTTAAVFDNLLCYDRDTRDFKPLLATSWRQVDERTLEMTLRDDVVFQDGTKFSADDVVYTLNWAIDPGNKLRYAADDLAWLDHAEKIDDHTVRIVAKQPTPLALIRFAISAPILPAKLHGALADKSDFGRKTPVGTGPYRVVSIDPGKGIDMVRAASYPQGSPCKPAAAIGHVVALPMPDEQTQVAQLATGGLELIRTSSRDQAEMMVQMPGLAVTASQGLSFHYMTMDAINRSGNAALSKLEVRQAIVKSIDRDLLGPSVLPGGNVVKALDALCLPNQIGCDYTRKPPAYDPVAAKRMLAEAGYPDGFDLELTAIPGSYTVAEALAGEMRKIGIRAVVDKATFGAYRQKQRDGKIQSLVGQWTLAGLPDVSATVDFYFDGAARDYWRDPLILKLAKDGLATLDPEQRKAIYRQIFDRVTEMSYVLPISNRPDVYIHSQDLVVAKGAVNVYGINLQEMRWK